MSQPQTHKGFSIAPAIFHAYPSLPPDDFTPPLERDERLQAILHNLGSSQAAVKDNIVSLIEQEAERLVSIANTELNTLQNKDSGAIDLTLESKRDVEVRRSAEEMIGRMKAKTRVGAELKEYEVGEEDLQFWDGRRRPGEARQDKQGDVEMSGTGTKKLQSAREIRRGLNLALQELVGTGVWYLNGYDAHTSGIRQGYEQALRRAVEKIGLGVIAPPRLQVITAGTQGPTTARSILKATSRADASPQSSESVRTLTSGSPATTDTMKARENIERTGRKAPAGTGRAVRFIDDVQSNSPAIPPERQEPIRATLASSREANTLRAGPVRASPPMDDPPLRSVRTVHRYNDMTCWWWNQGNCKKLAEECNFRHGHSPYGVAPDPRNRL